MKTSCIPRVAKDPIVILRKSYIEICDGDLNAAYLLSFFEYWHNIKVNMQTKNKQQNDVQEKHGDPRTQDETLLQFHSHTEIYEQCLGAVSKKGIVSGRKKLIELGFITEHQNPNPKYAFDKTIYYNLVIPHVVEMLTSNCQNDITVMPKRHDGNAKMDITITETTTKVSTEENTPLSPPASGREAGELKPLFDNLSTATKDLPVDYNKIKLTKKYDSLPLSFRQEVETVISYLNSAATKNYRCSSTPTLKNMLARFKEGFTVADMQRVIAAKVADWKDNPEMCKYLSPATLFCAKHFETYLDEAPVREQPKKEKRDLTKTPQYQIGVKKYHTACLFNYYQKKEGIDPILFNQIPGGVESHFHLLEKATASELQAATDANKKWQDMKNPKHVYGPGILH